MSPIIVETWDRNLTNCFFDDLYNCCLQYVIILMILVSCNPKITCTFNIINRCSIFYLTHLYSTCSCIILLVKLQVYWTWWLRNLKVIVRAERFVWPRPPSSDLRTWIKRMKKNNCFEYWKLNILIKNQSSIFTNSHFSIVNTW